MYKQFKVNDIVIVDTNYRNPYTYTNEDMIKGIVVKINKKPCEFELDPMFDDISIKVLEHKRTIYNKVFKVNSIYFRPIRFGKREYAI